MFQKNMKLSYLLDFYGEVLDEHTRGIMRAYYNDDLSLAEIAEDEGISRQGIRHVVKKGEEELLFLEERLSLAERNLEFENAIRLLGSVHRHLEGAEDVSLEDAKLALTKAIEIIKK